MLKTWSHKTRMLKKIFCPSYWKKDVYNIYWWSNAKVRPLVYKIYNAHNFFINFGGWNFASLKLLLCAISLYNQHSWIVFTSKLPCKKDLSSFSSGPLFFGLRSCRLVLFNRNIMMLAITIPETKPFQNLSEGVIFCARLLEVVNFCWEQQTNCLVTSGWRRIVGVFDMFQRERLVSKLAYRSEAPRNTAWNYSIVGNSLCWQTAKKSQPRSQGRSSLPPLSLRRQGR